MRVQVLACLLALTLLLPSPAQATELPTMTFGAGVANCASMLTQQPALSESWVLGFWTGMNAALASGRIGTGAVGAKQNSQILFDTVRLVCSQSPASTLFQAAQTAFWRMEVSER